MPAKPMPEKKLVLEKPVREESALGKKKTPTLRMIPATAALVLQRSLQAPPPAESLDPWIAIRVDELGKAYRNFARESGRLSRLAQRKKKACIPSEAFNELLAERIEAVEQAFQLYKRRKEELLGYIRMTTRRSGPASQARPAGKPPQVPEAEAISLPA